VLQIQCRARTWLTRRRVGERRMGLMIYSHTVACVATGLTAMQVLLRDFCTVVTFRRFAAIAIQSTWRGYITQKRHVAKYALRIQRLARHFIGRSHVQRRQRELREREVLR
jgi:hypothetical protein